MVKILQPFASCTLIEPWFFWAAARVGLQRDPERPEVPCGKLEAPLGACRQLWADDGQPGSYQPPVGLVPRNALAVTVAFLARSRLPITNPNAYSCLLLF